MAIIVNDKALCFLHIPKTAGSSVTLWLQGNFDTATVAKKHSPVRDIPPDVINNTDFFTIVRNPFERLHSWYHFKIQRANRFYSKRKHNAADEFWVNIESKTTFDSWVQEYFTVESNRGILGIKQVDYICEQTQFVLKQENLSRDFVQIQDYLDCHEPLPIHNVTDNRNSYKEDYTERSRRIVEDFFIEDLEYFNYTFDR